MTLKCALTSFKAASTKPFHSKGFGSRMALPAVQLFEDALILFILSSNPFFFFFFVFFFGLLQKFVRSFISDLVAGPWISPGLVQPVQLFGTAPFQFTFVFSISFYGFWKTDHAYFRNPLTSPKSDQP
jgi:hypothetical protein